jgi:hypothetical protein
VHLGVHVGETDLERRRRTAFLDRLDHGFIVDLDAALKGHRLDRAVVRISQEASMTTTEEFNTLLAACKAANAEVDAAETAGRDVECGRACAKLRKLVEARSGGRGPCAAVGAVPRPQSAACETEALPDVVMPDVSGRQLANLPRENDVLDPGTTF